MFISVQGMSTPPPRKYMCTRVCVCLCKIGLWLHNLIQFSKIVTFTPIATCASLLSQLAKYMYTKLMNCHSHPTYLTEALCIHRYELDNECIQFHKLWSQLDNNFMSNHYFGIAWHSTTYVSQKGYFILNWLTSLDHSIGADGGHGNGGDDCDNRWQQND